MGWKTVVRADEVMNLPGKKVDLILVHMQIVSPNPNLLSYRSSSLPTSITKKLED